MAETVLFLSLLLLQLWLLLLHCHVPSFKKVSSRNTIQLPFSSLCFLFSSRSCQFFTAKAIEFIMSHLAPEDKVNMSLGEQSE